MSEQQEKAKVSIEGWWWDEFYVRKNGKLVLDHVTDQRRNTRMDGAVTLMAALFANAAGISGVLYHAQGRGDAGWGASPPAVTTSDTTLFDEILRKLPDSVVFLDGSDNVVAGPTNIIRVRTTYIETEMAGETIREQALFGGDATALAGSGYIVNTIRADGIGKSGAVQLIRNIKLIFS